MKLVFATNNRHKLDEIRDILGGKVEVLSLNDINCHDDIPETWLKCGSYTKDFNFSVTNDIFIDTVTGQVFACQRDHKDIVDTWKSFDECLCSIYETLVGCDTEYLMD